MRQWFMRGVAWFGLAVYIPAFLIVLLWPGLIVAGAKKLIVQEVNERFEKSGGLKSTFTNKAVSLKEKFTALADQQIREEQDMRELGKFVDQYAEQIIADYVEQRNSKWETKPGTETAKEGSNRHAPGAENSQGEQSVPSIEAGTTTGTANAGDKSTGTVFSRLKTKLQSRISASDKPDGENTTLLLGSLILRVTAGSKSLLADAVDRGRVEIVRMQKALSEKYDQTVQALVRELRVFTGSNIFIFGLLWLASMNPAITRRLFPVSIVLLACTLGISYLYVMETDWIFSILHRSYVGWAYLIFVVGLTLYVSGEYLVTGEFLWDDNENETTAKDHGPMQ